MILAGERGMWLKWMKQVTSCHISVHALSVPCFLMGSSLGHPCFVTLEPRNVTATSVRTACGIVALHGRANVGGNSPARACSDGFIFTSTAVTSQHLSYLPGLFPQPVYLCCSAYTWSLYSFPLLVIKISAKLLARIAIAFLWFCPLCVLFWYTVYINIYTICTYGESVDPRFRSGENSAFMLLKD